MDPFSSSPSQPHTVLSSLGGPGSVLSGGQTPASVGFPHGSSIFGGQTPASTSGSLVGHSVNGPGSVLGANSFFHNSLLSGTGPGF